MTHHHLDLMTLLILVILFNTKLVDPVQNTLRWVYDPSKVTEGV